MPADPLEDAASSRWPAAPCFAEQGLLGPRRRREQGLAGGVEVVAVVVVAEHDRVDWAEVSGGDRRAGQLPGAGAQPKL
jgi:hypothetical protein